MPKYGGVLYFAWGTYDRNPFEDLDRAPTPKKKGGLSVAEITVSRLEDGYGAAGRQKELVKLLHSRFELSAHS